jgi:hypothetical protein
VITPTSADENPQPFELIELIEPFEHHKPLKPHKPLFLSNLLSPPKLQLHQT